MSAKNVPANTSLDLPAASETPSVWRRRKVLVPSVAALVLACGVAVVRPWASEGPDASASAVKHGVAQIVSGSLSAGVEVAGSLTYDSPTPVSGTGHGIITGLPKVGGVVNSGDGLYEVDGNPIVFLTGDRPMWRDLAPGVTGPDVLQLKHALAKLGHAGGLSLGGGQDFNADTGAAVKRWQKAENLPQTGTVVLGSVVFLPHDSVRVQQVTGNLGASASADAVLKVTGTELVAVVQPGVDQASRFKVGGAVTVRLPDGTSVTGKIRSVAAGTGGSDQDGSGDGPPKTTVTVNLDSQGQALAAGLGPATVTVIGDSAANVLMVPITALLAIAGGGYGVQVVDGRTQKLIPVTVGVIADGRAQIAGDVKAGMQVAVPE